MVIKGTLEAQIESVLRTEVFQTQIRMFLAIDCYLSFLVFLKKGHDTFVVEYLGRLFKFFAINRTLNDIFILWIAKSYVTYFTESVSTH